MASLLTWWGAHGWEGEGSCCSPGHCPAPLTHCATGPPPRWGRAGLGRAGGGGGETLAGEDGDRGKSQEGTCRGPTAAAAATVTTFVRLLFRVLSRPRQDKGAWSPEELSGVTEPWPGAHVQPTAPGQAVGDSRRLALDAQSIQNLKKGKKKKIATSLCKTRD